MQSTEENPDRISQADIIVGIPSYNESDSISFPTQQADAGLSKYFSGMKSVIINCDNDSPDGTRSAFLETPTQNPKIYLSTPNGMKGKGNNFRNLFTKTVDLSAKAVIVVDADLKSITPQWIRNLGEPLFEDFHFVCPLYVRHKYDGTITNNIAYPLTRALYGRRIRQPIGGDFGFSGELARIYMESNLMCRCEDFWREVIWSRPTAVFGFGLGDVELPPEVKVNREGLREKFSAGMQSYGDFYKEFLPDDTLGKLEEVAGLLEEGFEFPTPLWAKVLYDFACAYKNEAAPRDELITSLIPLYNGRVLSFVLETETLDTQQVEEVIEDQCFQFEQTKRYLLERWFSG
ncbi:MAG: glycosyl transferase [Deltaproteobacteria bacterium]